MRDEFYRSKCANPFEYDAVIDFIRDNNPNIQDLTAPAKEEFAVNAVHSCIRGIVYGIDDTAYYSTGMCVAIRYSMDPGNEGYRKVFLAVNGLRFLYNRS